MTPLGFAGCNVNLNEVFGRGQRSISECGGRPRGRCCHFTGASSSFLPTEMPPVSETSVASLSRCTPQIPVSLQAKWCCFAFVVFSLTCKPLRRVCMRICLSSPGKRPFYEDVTLLVIEPLDPICMRGGNQSGIQPRVGWEDAIPGASRCIFKYQCLLSASPSVPLPGRQSH